MATDRKCYMVSTLGDKFTPGQNGINPIKKTPFQVCKMK